MPHARGDEPHNSAAVLQYFLRMPHARGDEPKIRKCTAIAWKYAPRTWG